MKKVPNDDAEVAILGGFHFLALSKVSTEWKKFVRIFSPESESFSPNSCIYSRSRSRSL